jgi:threonine-phosphate decarboxylase
MQLLSDPVRRPAALFRHGGAPAGRGRILDCSASINPCGPSLAVRRALTRNFRAIASYPDPRCTALVARLAAIHGVGPNQVVIGNGSNELIHALPRAVRPKRVAIAEPTYTEYLRASLRTGARVAHYLAEGADFALEPFDPAGADLVWLCNPNNPTGQLWQRSILLSWIEANPRTVFVVDEAYLPFLPNEAEVSLTSAADRVTNLVVLRSFTKFHALPGLRLGYTITNPDLARRLRCRLAHWSVNALAQVAGLVALDDDPGFLRRTLAWVEEARTFLHNGFRFLSEHLRPVPTQSVFGLLRVHTITSTQLVGALRQRGIWVRDASNFVGLDHHHVRVSPGLSTDNQRLLRELTQYLATTALR